MTYKVTIGFKEAVKKLKISPTDDNNLHLSISCGVSMDDPGKAEKGGNVEVLIRRADEALLEAKRSGKDRVVYKDI